MKFSTTFKTTAIALAAGAAVTTVGFASASVLAVDGGTIQYGASGVTCDTNGVKVNWGLETDDSTVRTVRVADLATECSGAELFVSVDGAPAKHVTIDATSESIPLAPYADPANIDDVEVWIEG
jgi:hypothetical protein